MRKAFLGAALAASAMTSGCVSTGPLNGFSKDPMASVVVWRNPDTGPITDADWKIAVRHANWCKKNVTDKQLSGPGESAATMAVVGGVTGAAGVGGGGALGAMGKFGPLAVYGGVAGGANGVEVGLLENSNTRSAVTGTCVSQNLSDAATVPNGGLHATAAYVRTTNSSSKVAPWVVPASSVSSVTYSSTTSSTNSNAGRTLPPPPQPMPQPGP